MIGLGTLINTGAVVVAGLLGMLLKKGLSERFRDIVIKSVGLSVIFLGAAGALSKLFTINGSHIETVSVYMVIVSLALGSLIGELINLDRLSVTFGNFLKRKARSESDGKFTEGFVTASLTVCVGAMAIVGAIADGLTGDSSILITKSILDFIIVFVLSTNYGKGCAFSAVPVFIIQGGITLLAKLISPVITDAAMNNISLVGSMLIFVVGVNLMFDKKIKVANMVPSLIIAAAYSFLPF